MTCLNTNQNSSMLRYKLYSCLIELYDKFFHIENAVAYIEGRDYDLVKRFMTILNLVFDAQTEDEILSCKEKLSELDHLVDTFIDDINERYPQVMAIVSESNTICRDETPVGVLLAQDVDKHVDSIIKLNNALKYSADKLNFIPEVILTEVNNYLSHCATAWRQGSYHSDTGIGHLYRATLDAYKEVVLEKITQVTSNSDLQNAFVRLRMKETCEIGKGISLKDSILVDYFSLVKKLT